MRKSIRNPRPLGLGRFKSFYQDNDVTLYNADWQDSLPIAPISLVLLDPPYDLAEVAIIRWHDCLTAGGKTGMIVFSPPENQWLPRHANQIGFWVKPISTKNTSRHYSRFVEMLFFFGPLKWNSDRHWSQYTNVFTDLVDGVTGHPFEKPTSLIRRLILNHTDPGDTILDPCSGSGTTLVVAKQLGRKAIGIERERSYCEITKQRLLSL